MKESPTVSIACITYNQKIFVVELITSILSQTYTDWELVIGDDASTDGTQEVLNTYETQHPHKIYVECNLKNIGITNNFQKVLDRCRGKYVAWVGGDDIFFPNKLKSQVEFMEAHLAVALCYHDIDVFDSNTDKTLYLFNSVKPKLEGGVEKIIENGVFMGACSVMTRRSCHPPKGFDLRIPIASDWLFWIQTCYNGEIRYIDQVLSRYRKHEDNVTNKTHDHTEELITLAIALEDRPDLLSNIRTRIALLFLYMGVKQFKKGNHFLARKFLGYSLFNRLKGITLGFFGLSMLGNVGVNILEKYNCYIKRDKR